MPRSDPWRRDPFAPFDDLSREQFAQARAQGTGIIASGNLAGVSAPTATAFERDERMRDRIRELRRGAETVVGASVPWVLAELQRNAEEARGEKDGYKASNQALWMMYRIMSEDPKVAAQMVRKLPPTVRPRDLQRRLRDAFDAKRLPDKSDAEPIQGVIDVPAAAEVPSGET